MYHPKLTSIMDKKIQRKKYAKPALKVVELQHKTALLGGSSLAGVSSKRNGYERGRNDGKTDGSEEIWD